MYNNPEKTMKGKGRTNKKNKVKYVSIFIILVYFFSIIFGGLISLLGQTNAIDYNYTAPTLENTETGSDKVNTDETQSETLYKDKDGNVITDENKINELLNPTPVESVVGANVKVPVVATNLNFIGFNTPSSDGDAIPAFFRYFVKNGIQNYTSTPYKTYTDSYYTYLRMNGTSSEQWSYTTDKLNLQKEGLENTYFEEEFRINRSDASNGSYITLNDNLNNEYKFFIDNDNSKFTVNGTEVSRNAYFDNGKLIGPNVMNNLSSEQNLELRAETKNNGDGTSDLKVSLGRQINKNVIIYNGLGSEYDLVYRPHEGSNLDDTTWYGYTGSLARDYIGSSASNYTTDYTDSLYYESGYDRPRALTYAYPYYNRRTDYYLPVEIYNGTIVMDVYPRSNYFHMGIVSTKNAQRRMNIQMGSSNNQVQIGDNGNFSYICSSMLDHGYNNWYRLFYKIETRNGKQIIKLTTYRYDKDTSSGYGWVENGSCEYVFDSDYSGWKPNFIARYGYSTSYIGTIMVIPEDDIFKVGKPGWSLSTYYNPSGTHPNNVQEFLDNLNNSVNSGVTHFYGSNNYMTPMIGANGTRLGTDYRVKEYGNSYGGNIIKRDSSDYYIDVIKGYFNAKESGEYCFAVDGDDYVGIYLDGQDVVTWGGSHGWDKQQGKYHNGCIDLDKGFHNFVALHEEIVGGDNFIFYVKNPGDTDYHIISPELGEIYTTIFKNNGISYDTVNNFYEYTLKNIKNTEWNYKITQDAYNLINNIRYYGTQSTTMSSDSIVDYAYDLFLNYKMSIYGDDLSQDINTFNNEFWLGQDKGVVYNLISGIDRFGGIRNFDIKNGNGLGPRTLPNRANISDSYYSYEWNQRGNSTRSLDFFYDKGLIGTTLGIRWRRYKIDGYTMYSDLSTFGKKDRLAVSSILSSYYYSNDQDFRATAYSDGTQYNSNNFHSYNKSYKFLEALRENPNSTNYHQEYYVSEHKKDYEAGSSDLESVSAASSYHGLTLNNAYILDNNKKKVYQNDMLGYINNDISEFSKEDGNDIWTYFNDGDNDVTYLRMKSFYVDFKAYNIYRNTNIDGLGLTKDNPALSCHQIYNINTNSYNGYYWIKLDDNKIYKLFCDFREPFEGITEYVNIKGNYSQNDAKSCFLGNYILNENLECYNPNRFNGLDNVDKLYIFNDWGINNGGYWIYDTNTNSKSYSTKISTRYKSVGHPDYMTLMQYGSYPDYTDGDNTRRIRLGINFAQKYYNNSKIEDNRDYGGTNDGGDYQNYSKYGYYGKVPGGRESNARKGSIFWKEDINNY